MNQIWRLERIKNSEFACFKNNPEREIPLLFGVVQAEPADRVSLRFQGQKTRGDAKKVDVASRVGKITLVA